MQCHEINEILIIRYLQKILNDDYRQQNHHDKSNLLQFYQLIALSTKLQFEPVF